LAAMKQKQAQLLILSLSMALLLSAAALISFLAMGEFERVLVPELDKKGVRLAESVRSLLVKSIGYGVPLERLNGTTDYFDEVLAEHQETRYLALTRSNGTLLYASSALPKQLLAPLFSHNQKKSKESAIIGPYYNLSLPLIVDGRQLGTLHLGLDNTFVRSRIKEIGYDILTVLVIAFILTFELMLLIFSTLVDSPIQTIKSRLTNLANGSFRELVIVKSNREFDRIHHLLNKVTERLSPSADLVRKKEQNIIEVRGLLFFFIFSAMFPLSFLPIYIEQLYEPLFSLSKEFVLSLPFAAYYLVTALAIGFAGPWSEKAGRRRPMIIGALLGSIGYLCCALAPTLILLTASYCLAAIGFGLVMVACQGYIIDTCPREKRTSAIARFWAGFFSGTLCGTGIGAVLADRIGFAPTFMVAAGLSMVSALFMIRLVHQPARQKREEKQPLRLRHIRTLLSNGRFLALVFGLSIPAKICMTGFMFYLIPRFLDSLDTSQSSIGRILMIYSLMFVFVGPPLSRFFENRLSSTLMSILATILAGISLLLAAWQPGIPAIIAAVTLYALFRSSCAPATTTLILSVSSREVKILGAATVISLVLLLERLGNILGPVLAGLLINTYGMQWAMAGYGILTTAGAMLVTLVFLIHNQSPGKEKQEQTP